ncbi:MAG: glycine--tRNA ligase subunit beta [Gammaproteobacteria bacterium]|nr:glycine--tRNA ligase subunit beta [Gammaproteobacteria bacterium]MBU1408387.1 glycine--tRNA ligase subunit beta [Gammaproteobacteria bacterium]MBU1532199.1 glycine--tRNA ligase subunit beta [Gammaproteobacteria bacterium]
MSKQNLLVELFIEELPPKALKKLGESFASHLYEGLKSRGLAGTDGKVTSFASPRRLAVHICNVFTTAPDQEIKKKLMPVSIALDADGKPTEAFRKSAAKVGRADLVELWPNAVDGPDQLYVANDGKADAIFLRSMAKGTSLLVGLEGALEDALGKLPIPKVMTYPNPSGDGWETVNFVRPAHSLIALHGTDIVPVSVLGLQAGRDTQGHRFEARVSPVVIQSADSYASQLKDEGAVIASFAERRAEIVRQLQAAAAPLDLKPIEDDALLDEVAALVERPNVLVGQFEEAFLEVPQECLILTMKANQKYFPLLDSAGKLTNRFLIVSNISPADASAVIQGNERVVRPRLADAKFFFDQDRKKTMGSRVPGLAKVVYHNKLGSQGDRVERVRAIARWVAGKVGADAGLADRAVELAKADLLTDMVGEFPELQGIMGGYYARHDGEDERVAQAIADQYLVRRDETEEVSNLISEVLQIADRMETLVGIWGIGLKPTGDKDPFALRRHALSVIKSFQLLGAVFALDKAELPLNLEELIAFSLSVFPAGMLDGNVAEELKLFIYERNANQLTPVFGAEAVAAVFSNLPPLHDIAKRLRAVREFALLPESPSLAAANKRVGNILKKADGEVGGTADPARFVEAAESELFAAIGLIAPQADAAFAAGDYTTSLQKLAALKTPVDAFFDQVMVNADDPALKANRLALLNQLHRTMNRVADLSRLAA